MSTTTTTAYLTPIREAATLLQLRPFEHHVEQLAAVLDKLSRGYPQDVMPRLEALRVITGTTGTGTVEELEWLEKVWPDWSGDRRFKLTATTLTWTWASKHSGVYATITVPFPTVLPMQVEVVRFCDMDDDANHADECDFENCNCEGQIDQTVAATVVEWNDRVERELHAWLSEAVIAPVEAATFPLP